LRLGRDEAERISSAQKGLGVGLRASSPRNEHLAEEAAEFFLEWDGLVAALDWPSCRGVMQLGVILGE